MEQIRAVHQWVSVDVRKRARVSHLSIFYTLTQETSVRHELSRWLTAESYCITQPVDRVFGRLHVMTERRDLSAQIRCQTFESVRLEKSEHFSCLPRERGEKGFHQEANGISDAVPNRQIVGAITA